MHEMKCLISTPGETGFRHALPRIPLPGVILVLILLLCGESISLSLPLADTAAINIRNRSLLDAARRNPDLSITLAHKSLSESQGIHYLKGMADAQVVLGFAWLAKYNRGDSALFYCMKAYDLYRQIEDPRGKALACYGLAYVYSFKGDLPESERYGTLSLNFFEQAGDSRGMINAYSVLSYLAKQQKDFTKASALIQQAISIARSIKDTIPLADAMNSLGNIYSEMALFKQAIDAYFEALNLWEIKKDSNGIAIAYGSIGLMYSYQKEWDKALDFCFRKLPLSVARKDLWEVSKTYNTIAQIYNAKTDHDSALVFLHKSLTLNKQMNYPSGIANACHNLASTFLNLSQTDSAYEYINRAVSLAGEINDPAAVNYYVTLGNVYRITGHFNKALQTLRLAHDMGKNQRLPVAVRDAALLLSNIYSKMNRKDLAYGYLREYQILKDSISNEDFHRQVTRMELQYDFDKKQKAAEYSRMKERILAENKINKQKLYLNALLVILVLGILLSFLAIRNNRLRARYSRIDLEQRLLRAQMNPHFIFNSLCAVQDFILAGKPQEANTFLTKIAKLMRCILENTREEFISLERDLETLRLYLDIQKLRFEKDFEYNIVLDESIDPENISVPPMLAQPCVENSIEHGLLPSDKKGMISIVYTLRNGLMMLEVTDNGVGRKEAAKQVEKRKKQSLSTVLTNRRLEHFRKTFREKGISFNIIDLYDNDQPTGTKVVMILPYKKVYA